MNLQTLLTALSPQQWAGVAILLAAVWMGRKDLVAMLPALPKIGSRKPTKQDAFAAAELLLAYHESVGCAEGASHARAAGECLFHAPGAHA